ncbi:MAG: hypothetical protein QM286_05980 [Acidobacteriota bacterium]|nr:hypothetical protein [Acidobacteriota bacterium]
MSDYGRIAHEAYEEAAAKAGWETNPASRVPWEDVPLENRVATTAAANAVADAVLHEAAVTPPKRVDSTDPLIHQNANGTVTLEWRDDRTATLVSREFLDHMVQAHNAVNKGTITNPAWRRGYDAGINAERRAIVAWLSSGEVCPSPQVLAELIERGEHLLGDGV